MEKKEIIKQIRNHQLEIIKLEKELDNFEEGQIDEKLIGTLSKSYGLKSDVITERKVCDIGHPVYDTGTRYRIYLEEVIIKSGKVIQRPIDFYKETLKPHISFYEN